MTKPIIPALRKQITEMEEIISQLRIANTTLLETNEKLKQRLNISETDYRVKCSQLDDLQKIYIKRAVELDTAMTEKNRCRQKCELVIREKDQIIQQKEQCLRAMKNLADVQWTRDMVNGAIVLTGRLP